jgi:hypothetical protein
VEWLRLHHVSLFFAKRNSKKNVVKVLVIIMLKVQSQRKLEEEAAYLLPNFHKLLFLLPKAVLKNKINYYNGDTRVSAPRTYLKRVTL